jgi:hypothetical protein
MELKEAIEQINTGLKDFCFNPNFEEAIRKVVSFAEQVDGVRGIEDIPMQKLSSGKKWLPRWAETYNGLNAKWRALIVNRLEKVEETLNELDKVTPRPLSKK